MRLPFFQHLRLFVITLMVFAVIPHSLAATPTVIKSPNDDRTYLAFTLQNEMRVLVISDPETDKAAAALDVAVGSGNDPDAHLGMAHFLEHMLFLGTKKYPEAGEYQKFIAEHGGQHNAFTTFQHTNYFFDVDARFLSAALDRFSQQFVAPLFNEIYVDRERNAVHSEYTAKIKDDLRAGHSAFQAILNPKHAYSRFSVGNLTTLDNTEALPLREALIRFYEENYSSNLMTLTVYGKEPAQQLKRWVEERFSAVENRHLTVKAHNVPLITNTGPQLLTVKPVMDRRTLQISYSLPSQEPLYRQKPGYYVSNLIGHEGKGSLLSLLKEKGWVNALSAGMGLDTGHESSFVLSMELTQEGRAQWKEIARLSQAYIELIRTQGMNPVYYDEQKRMLDLAFQFQQKSTALNYVSQLANEMQITPVEEVIRGGYLLESYAPDLYQSFLSHLVPQNALITLTAQDVETEKKSEWYEAEYGLYPLIKEDIEPKKADAALFALPAPNDFIPQEVELAQAASMPKPKLLESSPGFESWFATDTEFKTPQSVYYLNIRSPFANDSALNSVQTQLMVDLLEDELNEFRYPAYLGGLTFKIYGHIRGITLRIEGYPEKQAVLLSRILNTMTNLVVRKDRFDISRENLQRTLENTRKRKPFEQTIMETRRLVTAPLWSDEEKLAALPNVTVESLAAFSKNLLKQLELVSLTHGNTTRAAALSMNQLVKSYLYTPAAHVEVPSGAVALLGPQDRVLEKMDIDHPDTSYVMLIQGRNISWEEKALFALATQIASPEYYREMRTEKQLGYIVFVMPFTMFEVPGIGFIVQSPVATPQFIHKDTEDFLSRMISLVAAMDDDTWEKNKQAVISNLLKKETQLLERSDRYWTEIDRNITGFDGEQVLAEAIHKTSKEALMQFIQEVMDHSGRKLLVVNKGIAEAIAQQPEADTDWQGWVTPRDKADLWKDKEVVQAR